MSKALNLAMFVLGVAVGIGSTYTYFRKKYEIIAQNEIDSVKESLSKAYEKKATVFEKPDIREVINERRKKNDASKKEMVDILKTAGYKPDINSEKPYVISPQEFGEMPEYMCISLTYYADGVVTDDDNEVLEDWADLVSADALTHFGEYEDDSVFIRNDTLKADYEILKDPSPYRDPDD